MRSEKTTIERALELASSGEYRRVTDVAHALRQERYDRVDANLSGESIRRQLRELIRKARPNEV